MHYTAQISIIIPLYQVSCQTRQTIVETLDSVFRQTFDDFEVIVIHDGATDDVNTDVNTVLQSIQDSRLKVFHDVDNNGNGSLAAGYNRGIQLAQGKYVIFLEPEDLWIPQKLESHVQALETERKVNPKAAVAYSWSYSFDRETQSYFDDRAVSFHGNVLSELLQSNFIASGSNVLVLREALTSIGLLNPEYEDAAAWDYWLRLSQHWDYVLIPERQVFHHRDPLNQLSSIAKLERDKVNMIRSLFQSLPTSLQPLQSVALANIYIESAQSYCRLSPSSDVTKCFRQALWQAIVLQPRLLLQRETQTLIRQSFLFHTLPHSRWTN
jgi:glycosyltransferase involved in cell wall biosynthesis